MTEWIKRPVYARFARAYGESNFYGVVDDRGVFITHPRHLVDGAREIAACINLAPKLAEALRLAVGIVCDDHPKLDMTEYKALLARWDDEVKQ